MKDRLIEPSVPPPDGVMVHSLRGSFLWRLAVQFQVGDMTTTRGKKGFFVAVIALLPLLTGAVAGGTAPFAVSHGNHTP